uniref:Chromosome 1 open reading frame 198 n=1 Tax=Erpetoichthys calabaricus TaxID=27687 RepID=A0A8C4RJQ1_ERPCA
MATAEVAGSEVLRMEEKKFEYFCSINPMARKIMLEKQKIKEKYGPEWDVMSPKQQDTVIDNWMMDPMIQARYAMHRTERVVPVCYPKLQIQTGQKIVHFGEEDITWQDEHSAPFSWETRSQMEFNLSCPAVQEMGIISAQGDLKPPVKTSQPIKAVPHGNNQPKICQNGKNTNADTVLPARKEEESSFWKISAERSRLEGGQSEFQSLTPSQIKSLEKGEKPLPSYLRQESSSKDKEEHKTDKQLASKQEKPVSVSSTVAEWEKSQTPHASVSTFDEVFTPAPDSKDSATKENDKDESIFEENLFSQTSSSVLKTGFDFLDNW